MFEVPAHGLAQSEVESDEGGPAEFGSNLGCIDGIAKVVAGSIGDEFDLLGVGAEWALLESIEFEADLVDDIEVGLFVVGAEGVGIAEGAV